jgi:hypothetical protein
MGAPRAATAQLAQEKERAQVHEFHCLEIFRIPRALGATARGVRDDAGLKRAAKLVVDEQYVVHSKGPFADGALAARSPITWAGEAAVVLVMTVVMGGPLVWSFALPAYLAVAGSWLQVGLYVAASAVLAYHPLPVAYDELYSSWFVEQMYRYFSYRMLWADDCRDEAMRHSPWLGAGVPHGAMPFANVLSVPAVNSFMYGDAEFVGAPASVVFRTPFLRYFTLFKSCTVDGPTLTREMAKGNNVGLVGDGIAGIFQCSDQEEVVALKSRKGLAKLALRTGRPVLPCYSMGNTSAFSVWYDSFGVMEWLSRKAQASIFVYWGKFGLPIPKRVNITMIIGNLVKVDKVVADPSEAEVDAVHQRILQNIEDAFNLHKGALGYGHKTMRFV